jgi:phosphoesterase RecJ-like protein
MAVEGVEVSLFFKEAAPGHYRVSLRSRGSVDVNEIARVFGGGGHQRASGCQIDMPLGDAKEALLAEVELRMKGGSGLPAEERS